MNGIDAPGTAPGVPAGTSDPSAATYWLARDGSGTGISQVITDTAVWASAGRTLTTAAAPIAPS